MESSASSKKSMLLNFRPSSFVSSRAHAWRQRFANSKRSLSDSCKDVPLIANVSTSSDCSMAFTPSQGSPQAANRFQQRRGAVVPVTLPEYDPDSYSCPSPVGSPTHGSGLTGDGVFDLLGLSSTPDITEPMPVPTTRSPQLPIVDDTARRFLWQPEAATPDLDDSAVASGFSPGWDEPVEPDLPKQFYQETEQLARDILNHGGDEEDRSELEERLQLLEERERKSGGSVRAAATAAVSVAVKSSCERPNFRAPREDVVEFAPVPPSSIAVQHAHASGGSGYCGGGGRSGGCCMPLPSNPSPTPSPPSPTPPSAKSSKQYGSGSHCSVYSRSESIASIGSGSGGCLSSLYSSLDRRSRMRLVHQMSMDETRCSVGRAATPAATAAAAAAAPAVANAVAAANAVSPTSSPDFAYRTLKASNASASSAAAAAISAAAGERRKKRLLRKQTNSAPDSLEDSSQFTDRLCVTYYLDNVYNKGRNLYARRSWQGEEGQDMLLKVTPDIGLRGRGDGNADGAASPYLNLPSPNVQNEENEADVFRKLSSFDDRADSDHDDIEAQGPPASALTRRRALVPPKLLSDQYESANDETDSGDKPASKNGSTESLASRKRRSSIVVIPPMQICPGDLLVYSKVLTHRNNLLDLDGSTQSLAVSDDANRKGKNTWSLLRLFDRSSRTKSESLYGLEEVLTTITPSDFQDEQLSRYKGMLWMDFVTAMEDRQLSPEDTNSGFGMGPSPANSTASSLLTSCSRMTTSSSTSPTRCTSNSPEPLRPARQEQAIQTVSKSDLKRQEAVWDLFQSECLFLYDHLMVLKNVFMEPLKKVQVEGFAMFAEPEVLFGNLDELCCVTYAFCKEFINLILQNVSGGELLTMEVLVKLFQKSSKAMSLSQAYHRYALNYINALNYLETLRRQVEFNEFEKWCSRDPRCKKLQLTDLLVAPVQHIMKIPIILKDIETRTEDTKEKEIILQILETEENSLRELDDKMKWLKNFERLLEIQRNIMWPSVIDLDPKTFIPDFLKGPLSRQPCERLIVSPRRQIIMEGALQLMDAGKPCEMYVILFDDMLLITRRKKGLHKKKSSITENWSTSCGRGNPLCDGSALRYIVYRQPLSLDRFYIHDVNPQDAVANKLENAFVLVNVNRFQQIVAVFTFQSPSDQTKGTWLTKLKETQERWKRTLQNTVFRNQRLSGTPVGVK